MYKTLNYEEATTDFPNSAKCSYSHPTYLWSNWQWRVFVF